MTDRWAHGIEIRNKKGEMVLFIAREALEEAQTLGIREAIIADLLLRTDPAALSEAMTADDALRAILQSGEATE
jgi:hypothetical protein